MRDDPALLPDLDDPVDGPFWRAVAGHRLVVQGCVGCDYLRWPPAPLCPECGTPGGEWREVAGRGTLWSYTIYARALHAAFADEIPYTSGLIELECGVNMIGLVRGAVDEMRIGSCVVTAFENVGDATLVRWIVTGSNREGK